MSDVRDKKVWEEQVEMFRTFAASIGAEFHLIRLANGKETIICRQWYVPRKEVRSWELIERVL